MAPPSLHHLAEQRSLALHALVAERLAADPSRIERARARVAEWGARGSVAAPYVARWAELLDGPLPTLLAMLRDPGDEARALRQVSPFAGVIEPRTRWQVNKRVREELGR